ncbi:uncharacterized protein LAJ45_07714 [Morchella importuna]|uniref:uncharacterized protein n=1 Tax=Morchella importuna TaxID=1174673 RepID=UPI001E8CC59E|nr:uncharacterized protein LAJ45_07714 [Morchella importuna]KAH8148262.1 hypothetical protein LAJ45_07714 [Morchella importuna]
MAGPIRHPIDLRSLESYLNTHAPHIKTPLSAQQFGYGQSNPTYLLTSTPTGAQYVLRKKPPGQLLSKTAHQVEREYKVLKALSTAGGDVPAPKVYCLCEDAGVLGSAFYIMEYLNGRIFDDPSLPGVATEARAAMWKSAITTLAKLHAVDPAANEGLRSFGRPNGFYGRQIKTLSTIEAAQAATRDVKTGKEVGKVPRFEEMMKFFSTTQPKDRSAVIHGDYKIDNLVFHPTEPYVIGILDWELSTIGHPLSDLANLLLPWQLLLPTAAGVSVMNGDIRCFLPDATPGLPTREEAISWYAEASGWKVKRSEMLWGDAFGFVRNAIIMQGIGARVARGQASSAKAEGYGSRVPAFAACAWRCIEMSEEERVKEERAGAKL